VRRLKLSGHGVQGFGGHLALALAVAGQANVEGHVEVDGLDLRALLAGQRDPRLAPAALQMRGVEQCNGAAASQALAQQVAHGGKNAGVDGLIRGVITEQLAQGVGRDHLARLAGGPSGFAGTGQARQHENSLHRLRAYPNHPHEMLLMLAHRARLLPGCACS